LPTMTSPIWRVKASIWSRTGQDARDGSGTQMVEERSCRRS
jgi:hypothetical protein